MPSPKKPCPWPGCNQTIKPESRYCREHYLASINAAPDQGEASDEGGDEQEVSAHVTTLDELLDAARVDTDIWYVEDWVANVWDGKPQVKARLKRRRPARIEKAIDELLDRLPPADPLPHPSVTMDGEAVLAVYCPFDWHFGKLAWALETGEHYDCHIATAALKEATRKTLAALKAYSVTQVMIPLGHDLLHFDNIWGTTTSGTPMDTDGRWAKVFNAAFDAFRHVIGWIAESYPVHVLHVPGNHDRTTSWYLCRTLEEHFRASRHVTVDASPNRRKYTRWGVTLIASTHGEKEDHRSLPTIMAQEAPRYWADTSERVWLLGHTHQRKTQATTPVNTVDGVELRTMISPAGRDAWHHEMGYIGGRKQAETLLYGYESGFRGSVVATIDPALYAAEEAS